MEKLIKITPQECMSIAGGRNEMIAEMVENIAMCFGAFARLIYLASKKSRQTLVMQAENGMFPKY